MDWDKICLHETRILGVQPKVSVARQKYNFLGNIFFLYFIHGSQG
jgi:hypothetical protein